MPRKALAASLVLLGTVAVYQGIYAGDMSLMWIWIAVSVVLLIAGI